MKTLPTLTLAVMLSLALAACGGDGNNNTPGGDYVFSGDPVPGSSLAGKLAWLQENAVSGGSYIIEVDADENTAPVELNFPGIRVTVILRGAGANRTISVSSNASLITLYEDVTLVLDNNITLKDRNNTAERAVSLWSGGTSFIMNPGSALIGGGIGVSGWGDFVMNGGIISSQGIGVDVRSGKTVTMKSGTIKDSGGPGVYVQADGTFIMNGGTITGSNSENGNVAGLYGHAIYAGGMPPKNTTSGPRDNLSYNAETGKYTGAWDK